jgi:hypothetical protein
MAVRWTPDEARRLAGKVRSLLRGWGADPSPERVDDYLSALQGLPAAWCLGALEELRMRGGLYRCPTPGDVRQVALEPRCAARREECEACGLKVCKCGAVEPPEEAVEAMKKLGLL